MSKSLRCKLFGCQCNSCGVCTRCGDEQGAEHRWAESPRAHPCIRLEVCEVCKAERQRPEHDWESIDGDLKCSRCGMKI